uniref:Chromo domain-containing protein n=1 Tax=Oryzias latipes TaxID=8090 RepID=A0A3P9IQC1_ORYLA
MRERGRERRGYPGLRPSLPEEPSPPLSSLPRRFHPFPGAHAARSRPGGPRKLHPRYIGPFPITRVINPVAVRLDLPRSMKVHPVFHVSKLKPAQDSPLQPAPTPPPAPRMVDGGPVYTIREILASRRVGQGIQYLIDWEGYGPVDRQCVTERHICDPSMIARFHRLHPDQPRRGPSGSRT